MNVIGVMSGTSLDGLDIALCSVTNDACKLLLAETIEYPTRWQQRLSQLTDASAFEYVQADIELGHYIGQRINDFIYKNNISVDLVASHGHTVFHQPDRSITTQIGNGDAIAAETGLRVVSNFRTLDVALGGQGAPLVPIGDEILFGDYDACLNLGGIANISYRTEKQRIAFDICPCNMALNYLAQKRGMPYDRDGIIASKGELIQRLNKSLHNIDYYKQKPPKSLGKEWFTTHFLPLIDDNSISVENRLHTVCDHIAQQIATVVNKAHINSMLVTGGGAHNKLLIAMLHKHAPLLEVTVPNDMIINYKEAIIFALLGYLRFVEKVNTLSSVTGARCDSVGGNLSGVYTK